MRIISQRYIGDGQFMLQLGGLSSETKPTDAFVATGSQFFEDDTDAVFTFSGLTWNLEKNGQMKDLPVVTSTDNGKVLKVANGVWSVGEGGGGGGAEKFIVTLTQENDTWTADKTVAEIVAADAANQVVVCKVVYETDEMPPIEIPLSTATDNFALFGGISMPQKAIALVAYGYLDGGVPEWGVETVEIGSSNAPLIVTLTAGATENQLVGDKTNKEVYDAITAGQAVILSASVGQTAFKLAVQYATFDGTDYEFAFIDSTSVKNTVSGGANDYVTASLA